MPDPARPSFFHAHSPYTLTEDSIILSRAYSFPLLRSWPCTVPSSYKSKPPMYSRVWILTKDQLSFWLRLVPSCSLSLICLSLVWNTPDFHSFLCHSIVSPRNPGANDSSDIAHKLRPGLSVRVNSGTPSLPGLELAHPLYNIKEIPQD